MGDNLLIHITFKQSTRGMLDFSFKNNTDVVFSLGDFLGEGPIKDLAKLEGLEFRLSWLKNRLGLSEEHVASIEQDFKKTVRCLEEVKEHEKVAIWFSDNASEQFGMKLVCTWLADKNVLIQLYNCSENMSKLNNSWSIRNTGEVNSEQVQKMIANQMFHIVTAEQNQQYKAEVQRLTQSDAIVRTWKNGIIIEDKHFRDDAQIMAHAKKIQLELKTNEYFIAARLIGEVLGWSEHDISDAWIEYRLRELIKEGLFEYVGDLREMRLYKIRVKNNPVS